MRRKTQLAEEPEIPRSIPPRTGIELLRTRIQKAKELLAAGPIEASDVDVWANTTRDYLIKAFGSKSPNVNAVLHASGEGPIYGGMPDEEWQRYLTSGLENRIKMLDSCIEQLETEIRLSQAGAQLGGERTEVSASSRKVFIVHGRDEALKHSTARFLENVGLEPVILHEQPSEGRTVIEKVEEYSSVAYAVVLLTPDDVGGLDSSRLARRARQNVVFEMGYFIGRLGRDRVCALYQEGVELPSDFHGVVYVLLDSGGAWQFTLAKELKAAGFEIDLNRAL